MDVIGDAAGFISRRRGKSVPRWLKGTHSVIPRGYHRKCSGRAPQLCQCIGLDCALEASEAPTAAGWGVWFQTFRGLVLASVYAQTLMVLGQCFAFSF